MEATKGRFANLTTQQIEQYLEQVEAFLLKYSEEGPETVGEDLDLGLKMIDVSKIYHKHLNYVVDTVFPR